MSKVALRIGHASMAALIIFVFGSGCAGGPRKVEGPIAGSDIRPAARTLEGPFDGTAEGAGGGNRRAAEGVAEVEWRILNWPQGKQAAATLTFDDGTLDQYEVALPLMEKYGVRSTYFIITGPRGNGVWVDGGHSRRLFGWDAAVEIAARGHEIGSHGVSHRDLRQLLWNAEFHEIERELQWSWLAIQRYIPEEHLPAGKALSFSWPYWRTTPQLEQRAEKYYIAARSGRGRLPLRIPLNPFAIHSVRVMSEDSIEEWQHKVNAARISQGWVLFSLHGIDNGRMDKSEIGWQPVSTEKFTALLQLITADDVWTAPFGEVYRYSAERNCAQLQIVAVLPDGIVLRLEDGLDDEVFNQALSIELSFLGEFWGGFAGAVAESSRGRLLSQIEVVNSSPRRQTVRFDLEPNGEKVIIRGSTSTVQLYNK